MTEQLQRRFLIARRKYISSQFKNLNPMQQEAVLTTEGPLLLLAGAGSGKTTVLINRVANILRFGRGSDSSEISQYVTEDDVLFLEQIAGSDHPADAQRADDLCSVDPAAPWQVIAITFTNKAADELKQRLENMLGVGARDVWAMTFHSACCRILRREIHRLGYGTSFTIYDTADSERIMKEIIKDMGLDDKTFPAKYVLAAISREKDRLISPEEMLESSEKSHDMRAMPIAKAYSRYQKRLKENNAVDFDDILCLTVQILQQFEDVRQFYQRKFRYVLVDEYQDTNHVQYLLTSLLAGGYENICVVGDDDQSIYRFRGATIENILSFEKQYRGARVIRLEQNYRSTQSILHAANAVISHNLGRKGKKLWTANDAGDPVTIYEASDEGAEANYVANRILAGTRNGSYKDHAILYRTNAQSNALEYAMKRNGIPYRIIGGTRFFDRAEVKDMLAYLCVINNRADDLRLKRIINNPPRGLGAKSLETVERLAQSQGLPIYDVARDPYSYAPLEKTAGKLLQFCGIIEGLSSLLDEGLSLPEFYEELLQRTGYAAALQSKDTEENRTRYENIRELKSSILSYVEDATSNGDEPTLAGFLEEIALYTDIEQYNDSEDAVVMMTMHSAKGLEFPHVFLVGFEEGLFPGQRSIGDAEEMEEERRLCYVAITRAKKTLTISHAHQRMLYGRTTAALPSRFIKEIPDEHVVKKGVQRQSVTSWGGFDGDTWNYQRVSQQSRVQNFRNQTASVSAPKQTFVCNFSKGDMVYHTAFGRGLVLSVMPLSGDALLEIAFDEKGTRKLMAKTGSAHMKKL